MTSQRRDALLSRIGKPTENAQTETHIKSDRAFSAPVRTSRPPREVDLDQAGLKSQHLVCRRFA